MVMLQHEVCDRVNRQDTVTTSKLPKPLFVDVLLALHLHCLGTAG
jgi:hypothetical protein